jgi:hypothetical protein
MEMDRRLPDLSDKELENLHANAVRLAQSGTPTQRQQAENLLPLIGIQIEARNKARAEKLAETRRAKVQRRAQPQADMKAESDEFD